jgi:DNA modification methylase
MNQSVVSWVNPTTLQTNTVAASLYSIPENYETIKENIRIKGILEPLIVSGDVIVSGNLRHRIALELGIDLVPVIFTDESEPNDEMTIVSHAQQRIKSFQEVLAEYEILEKAYKPGQGCRTDKDEVKRKHKKILEEFEVSKAMMNTLKKVKALAIELYGVDSDDYKKVWEKVNSGKIKPNTAKKNLEKMLAERINRLAIPTHYEISETNFRVYNKSCQNMNELEDGSVACIYTSPAYFGMRDYGTGKFQRGMEPSIPEYIKGLISDFSDCWRVLKEDGSFWVNINEPVIDGSYHVISHQFVLAMLEKGWLLNDEWTWFKSNAQFTQAKRAVRTHEYIFHFVKTKEFYYDKSWLDLLDDPDNRISRGTKKKVANLISGIDFRGSVLSSSANNMTELKKKCRERGFELTHTAGFPITLPAISLLATSKEDDLILDTCNGTGSTGETAVILGRRYVGYEIKPEFIMASDVRLTEYKSNVGEVEGKIAA